MLFRKLRVLTLTPKYAACVEAVDMELTDPGFSLVATATYASEMTIVDACDAMVSTKLIRR